MCWCIPRGAIAVAAAAGVGSPVFVLIYRVARLMFRGLLSHDPVCSASWGGGGAGAGLLVSNSLADPRPRIRIILRDPNPNFSPPILIPHQNFVVRFTVKMKYSLNKTNRWTFLF